jgi:hypothetical protein
MGAMTLTQMEDLLTKAALTPDQITTLIKRIQTVSKAQETLQKMKHLREDEHDSDYRSKKHRDVNYTQVEVLELTSSIREWSGWKAATADRFRSYDRNAVDNLRQTPTTRPAPELLTVTKITTTA